LSKKRKALTGVYERKVMRRDESGTPGAFSRLRSITSEERVSFVQFSAEADGVLDVKSISFLVKNRGPCEFTRAFSVYCALVQVLTFSRELATRNGWKIIPIKGDLESFSEITSQFCRN
jgi:hypothetical protein